MLEMPIEMELAKTCPYGIIIRYIHIYINRLQNNFNKF